MCPSLTPTNLEQNVRISDKLRELSHIDRQHLFAIQTNDTYYKFSLNDDETFSMSEIAMLASNPLLMAAVFVSVVFGLYCA